MSKLYYKDRYRKKHNTFIKKIIKNDKGFGIILEETIFFPGGGGQICDTGFIYYTDSYGNEKKVCVIEVFENEDLEIIHIIKEDIDDININKKVKIEIDWKRRVDSMCQHTGQHLLSGCFFKLFGRNTKGLHIGKDVSQLDIEGIFTDEMVSEAENMANDIINKKIDIKNYILSPKEKREFRTRRPLPMTNEEIRILEIPDVDINACCGVHLLNTGDLNFIKIKKYYKHKDGTRFEYLAGKRAVDYVLERDRIFEKILNRFNCNELNIENAVENLERKKDEMYDKTKYISQKYIKNISESILKDSEVNKDGVAVIKKVFDNEEQWLMADIAKYLSENYRAAVLFGNISERVNSIHLQVSKKLAEELSYINLGKSIQEGKKYLDIKGGGSKFSAQGICKNKKDIDIFLDNIYHIYIEK